MIPTLKQAAVSMTLRHVRKCDMNTIEKSTFRSMAVYSLGEHNTNSMCETLYLFVHVYICVGLCMDDAFQAYYCCFCTLLGGCTCDKKHAISVIYYYYYI